MYVKAIHPSWTDSRICAINISTTQHVHVVLLKYLLGFILQKTVSARCFNS